MATLSFANMKSVKTCQYGGEEKDSMWIGTINNVRNYRATVYFTPSVALTKVSFTLYCNHYANYSGEYGHTKWFINNSAETVIKKSATFSISKGTYKTFSCEYNFQPNIEYGMYIGAPWNTWNYGIKFSSTNVSCTTTVASFTVTYNGNGGTVSRTSDEGASITLPTATECTRPGYQFLGWASNSTASAADYPPGAVISPTANITLYAIWSLSICHIYLADSSNTVNKYRAYVYTNGSWALHNPHVYTNGIWIPTESITQAPNYETPDMGVRSDLITYHVGLSLSNGTSTGNFYLGYMNNNYHWLRFKFVAPTMASSLKFRVNLDKLITDSSTTATVPWKLKITETPVDPDGDTTATTFTINSKIDRSYWYTWNPTGINLVQGKTYYISVWGGSSSYPGGVTGSLSYSITLNPSS